MTKKTRLLGTLVLSLVAGIGQAAGSTDAGHAWTAAGESADAVRLAETWYQVDALGAFATGWLVERYVSAGDEVLDARYEPPRLPGLRTEGVRIEIDGEVVYRDEGDSRRSAAPARRPAAKRRSASEPPAPEVEIKPSQEITVRVGIETSLTIEEGAFRLRLPAPSSSRSVGRQERSPDEAAATTDAAPSFVRVVIHHREPPLRVESSSHEIFTLYGSDRTVVELAGGATLGARDFELDFAFGREDEPSLHGFVRSVGEDLHEVTAVLSPPSEPRDEAVRAKQLVLVLDTSGSMGRNRKLDRAREALVATLEQLRDGDTFNVIEFDGGHSSMSPRPVAVRAENLDLAREWLGAQRANGSTKLLEALVAAFAQPSDPERHRMIVVLTDGQVQDRDQVAGLLEENRDRFRLFFVGVGDDVNRENLTRFTEICRGTAAFTDESDDLGATVAVLFEGISRPLAWDLEFDWGGADVETVRPRRLPDLYAGRAVTVVARVRGEVPPTLRVHGVTTEGQRTFTVVLPYPSEESYLQRTAPGR